MLPSKIENVVVFLPDERAFGWDYASDPALFNACAGLLFYIYNEDCNAVVPIKSCILVSELTFTQKRMEPLLIPSYNLVQINSLPCVQIGNGDVMLSMSPYLSTTGAVYPLNFYERQDAALRTVLKALEYRGITPNRRYKIDSFAFDKKAISLVGVTGYFYTGLFDPAQ